MTDAYLKKSKPGYLDYAARTPPFLPRIFGGRP
jgi:steroid 5-alpha reductase family enzyme